MPHKRLLPGAMTAVALGLLAHPGTTHADEKQPEPTILKKHAQSVHAVAFSPDGKTLAASDDDGVIILWDVATWKPRATMRMPARFVRGLSWSGDSKMLVTGDKNKSAQLWDATTGKPLGDPLNQGKSVWAVAMSRDGKLVATGGNGPEIRVWDVKSRKQLGVYRAAVYPLDGLAFSPLGKLLAASGGGSVQLYNLDRIEGQGYPAITGAKLAFSGDGKAIASVLLDGRALVRDMITGKERVDFQIGWMAENTLHAIALNADASFFAVALDNHMRLFDGRGRYLAELRGHTGRVFTLSFSPDGKALASSGDDTTIRVWKLPEK